MTRKHLQAVDPDAPVPPQTPKSITEALEGTGRDVLAAMRRQLAQQLDEGKIAGNAIASSYRELRELDRLIRAEDEAAKQEAGSRGGERTRRSFNASAI